MKNPLKKIIPLVLLIGIIGFAVRTFLVPTSFRYAGTVETTKIHLSSRLSSVIAQVLVHEGQIVNQGDSLVVLDCEDLKVQGELAAANFSRAKKLLSSGSMPAEVYDQTQNRKKESDLKLSWCDIKAPIAGKILTRYREPAEWVTPGARVLTMANLNELWSTFYVPAPVMAKLKLGDSVEAYFPDLFKQSVSAKMIKINEEAEFTPKNVQTRDERTRLVFGIKIAFENPDPRIKPGMSVEISIPESK